MLFKGQTENKDRETILLRDFVFEMKMDYSPGAHPTLSLSDVPPCVLF